MMHFYHHIIRFVSNLLKCEDIPECEENVDTCVKDAHEDTESYPESLEEPFCSNSSDIATLNRCSLKVIFSNLSILDTMSIAG